MIHFWIAAIRAAGVWLILSAICVSMGDNGGLETGLFLGGLVLLAGPSILFGLGAILPHSSAEQDAHKIAEKAMKGK
jgi:hypothetical protein